MKKLILILAVAALGLRPGMAETLMVTPANPIAQDNVDFKSLETKLLKKTPAFSGPAAARALTTALNTLKELNREREADTFLAAVAAIHPDDPELALAIAEGYLDLPHHGMMVNAKFMRGNSRNWNYSLAVDTGEYDRLMALRTLAPWFEKTPQPAAATWRDRYFPLLARALNFNRGNTQSWQLQSLSDLTKPPTLPEPDTPRYPASSGAPVDAAGNPVLYRVPASFAAAASDGERLRALIRRWRAVAPAAADIFWCDWLQSQFGLATTQWRDDIPAAWTLKTENLLRNLKDEEFIAALADGVRRFKLPDDCNFLKIARAGTDSDLRWRAAQILVDRHRFTEALPLLTKLKAENHTEADNLYRSLTRPSGKFLPSAAFAAGAPVGMELVYRNAASIRLSWQKVDAAGLIAQIKRDYRTVQPPRSGNDAGREPLFNPEDLDDYLMRNDYGQFLGAPSTPLTVVLAPGADCSAATARFELGIPSGGWYWVTGTFPSGATIKQLIAVNELALIWQPYDGAPRFFVADARTGAPVPEAQINVFGSRFERATTPAEAKSGRGNMVCVEKTFVTNRSGIATPEPFDSRFRLLVTVQAGTRQAFLSNLMLAWSVGGEAKIGVRCFAIPDAPIYKPGETVQYTFFIREPDYTCADNLGSFPGRELQLELRDPRGATIKKFAATVDRYGQLSGSLTLPDTAALGRYQLIIKSVGRLTFAVEEYKKPEISVTVRPESTQVQPGAAVPVTIQSDYFFGAPAAGARVAYVVTRRTVAPLNLFPAPWRWLYGENYQLCSAYAQASMPPNWWHRGAPERVKTGEAVADAAGKVVFTVATAGAADQFGDQDSVYTIRATVTDASRTTAGAQAEVRVAARPFQLQVVPERGFYRAGAEIRLALGVYAPDGTPLTDYRGQVELRDAQNQVVGTTSFTATPTLKLTVARPGRYFAAVSVTARGAAERVEIPLLVRGASDDPAAAQAVLFGDHRLAIALNQATFAIGDTAEILVTADAPEVPFFYVIQARGSAFPAVTGSGNTGKAGALFKLPITADALPNFHVEAFRVSNGALHRVSKNIPVPPTDKLVNLTVTPESPQLKPNRALELTLRLADATGHPVTGPVAVAIYDAALDAAADALLMPPDRCFWGWTRPWHSFLRSNLSDPQPRPCWNDPVGDPGFAEHGWSFANPHPALFRPVGIRSKLIGGHGAVYEADAAPAPAAIAPASVADNAAATASADTAPTLTIRRDFADRAFFIAQTFADATGKLKLTVKLPENLTTWRIKAWCVTPACTVGSGESSVVVNKDILARLVIPRFLNTSDTATATVIAHNLTAQPTAATLNLNIDGAAQTGRQVTLAGHGEAAVDFPFAALPGAGTMRFTAAVTAAAGGDALELTLPVQIYGIRRQVAASRTLTAATPSVTIPVNVPKDKRPGSALLTVNYSPSLALSALDAIPFLLREGTPDLFSTVARFAPAVAAQRLLQRFAPELAALEKRLNSLDATTTERSDARFRRYNENPIFHAAKLEKILADSIFMLEKMQNRDGGFGWFSGHAERSGADTTSAAFVAMIQARAAGLKLSDAMLQRTRNWLSGYLNRRAAELKNQPRESINNLDSLVLSSLSHARTTHEDMLARLYADRNKLSPYGLSLLGIAMHNLNRPAERAVIIGNLSRRVVRDTENQTAYLEIGAAWPQWLWFGNENETQSNFLTLLTAADVKNPLARELAKYLAVNLKNNVCANSPRTLAHAVTALADYAVAAGEAAPDMNVIVSFDGVEQSRSRFTAATLFSAGTRTFVPDGLLTPGAHRVEIRVEGTAAALYVNTFLNCFDGSAQPRSAGLELRVKRRVYELKPDQTTVAVPDRRGVLGSVSLESRRRTLLAPGAAVAPGTLLEIELELTAKNDYEYIVVSDGKLAGAEPLHPRSAYSGENGAYVEYREREVRFYLHRLGRGGKTLRYVVRAQTPGRYHALPAVATGVYAPELHANSDGLEITLK